MFFDTILFVYEPKLVRYSKDMAENSEGVSIYNYEFEQYDIVYFTKNNGKQKSTIKTYWFEDNTDGSTKNRAYDKYNALMRKWAKKYQLNGTLPIKQIESVFSTGPKTNDFKIILTDGTVHSERFSGKARDIGNLFGRLNMAMHNYGKCMLSRKEVVELQRLYGG